MGELVFETIENILEKEEMLVIIISTLFTTQNFRKVFNALPDDKILGWSKLKQIADDILKCT